MIGRLALLAGAAGAAILLSREADSQGGDPGTMDNLDPGSIDTEIPEAGGQTGDSVTPTSGGTFVAPVEGEERLVWYATFERRVNDGSKLESAVTAFTKEDLRERVKASLPGATETQINMVVGNATQIPLESTLGPGWPPEPLELRSF